MEEIKPLKIIHVDDDPMVIRHLKLLLDNTEGVIYLKSFNLAIEALAYLKEEEVDLALLDIEMPEHNGLWLAEQIKNENIEVAFMTGHAGYAIQAFEVCAVDYLLKPLSEEKITVLLEKVRRRKQTQTSLLKSNQLTALQHYFNPNQHPTQIFINMVGQIKLVKLVDVIYFNSSSNYTWVVMVDGERYTSSKTIKVYIDALQNHPDFKRVSRSYMINKTHARTILRHPKTRQITLTMVNGDVVETSYKTKEEIMEKLG